MNPLQLYQLSNMRTNPLNIDPTTWLLLMYSLGSGGTHGLGLGKDARGPRSSAERTAETLGNMLGKERGKLEQGLWEGALAGKLGLGFSSMLSGTPLGVLGGFRGMKSATEESYENAIGRLGGLDKATRAGLRGARESLQSLEGYDDPTFESLQKSLIGYTPDDPYGGIKGMMSRAAYDAEERAARTNKTTFDNVLGAIMGMLSTPQMGLGVIGGLDNPDMDTEGMRGLGQSGGMNSTSSGLNSTASGADGSYW